MTYWYFTIPLTLILLLNILSIFFDLKECRKKTKVIIIILLCVLVTPYYIVEATKDRLDTYKIYLSLLDNNEPKALIHDSRIKDFVNMPITIKKYVKKDNKLGLRIAFIQQNWKKLEDVTFIICFPDWIKEKDVVLIPDLSNNLCWQKDSYSNSYSLVAPSFTRGEWILPSIDVVLEKRKDLNFKYIIRADEMGRIERKFIIIPTKKLEDEKLVYC